MDPIRSNSYKYWNVINTSEGSYLGVTPTVVTTPLMTEEKPQMLQPVRADLYWHLDQNQSMMVKITIFMK